MNTEKFLHPNHPVRFFITGPSCSGKSLILAKLILKIFNEYDKLYINSPSLHQDLYPKLNKCLSNCIPIHIIPNILNEKYIDVVLEEIVKNNDFEKSDTEIKTYELIEEIKLPQENENNSIIISDHS